jgi:transcriptional regulator with XRE-family HTH domain
MPRSWVSAYRSSQQRASLDVVTDVYEQLGKQIREFGATLRGRGMSQEELAQAGQTTANMISRWQTATYKPSISDLEKLAQFFGVPVTVFFPQSEFKSRAKALLSATADLDDADLEEIMLYARCRRARHRARRRR